MMRKELCQPVSDWEKGGYRSWGCSATQPNQAFPVPLSSAAEKLGGLSRNARLALKSSARSPEAGAPPRRKLTPGTRLVRDWHGTGHTVTVLDSGFEYDQRRWSSLTSIARHITGAKWSGPRFFGLTGAAS